MSSYRNIPLSRNSLLALLETDPDPDVVRVASTGQVIPSPSYAARVSGVEEGTYELVERAYPRRWMLENQGWALLGVDPESGSALVRLDTASGPRYLSCDLTVRKRQGF